VSTDNILVIGGGKMGGALIRAWLDAGVTAPRHLWLAEPDEARARTFGEWGVQVGPEAGPLCAHADTIVVAVKPQVFSEVIHPLADALADKLVISILAGVSVGTLAEYAPQARWVRAMPNQPAVVRRGATGLYTAQTLDREEHTRCTQLFEAVGIALWLRDETLMHAVTALSGGGPAVFAVLAEACEDAAVQWGLARAEARRLTLATMAGAAAQMEASNGPPSDLKDAVTSPAGTTIEAIAAMEQAGVRAGVIEALGAAARRSRTLAGEDAS